MGMQDGLGANERVLPFAGIHNFRDYGDYPAGGGRLAKGRLYRSAQHQGASPDDLLKVGALGLSTVVDLRGAREREAAPCPRPDGFAARVIFTDEETAGLAPHLQAAREADGAEGVRAAMCRGYGAMPFRPFLVQVMRDYFAALASDRGPALVHCAAGKDRTGLAVALLHSLLGVHRDDMMADYLLTNVAGHVEARIEAGASVIRSQYGTTLSDDAIRALMMVEPDYLDAAFAGIVARHGSVDGYLRDELAVDPERRDAIRARLLV